MKRANDLKEREVKALEQLAFNSKPYNNEYQRLVHEGWSERKVKKYLRDIYGHNYI